MGKRILTIVFATLMAMVTFTACSDDEDIERKSNRLKSSHYLI